MAGILAIGETLGGPEADYGLNKLNQMTDMWAADRLTIYRAQRTGPFTLVAGTGSYAVGDDATWDIARPLWIDGAGVVIDPSIAIPVEIELDVLLNKEWQQVSNKTLQSTLPQRIWYDRTFPNGTVYVHPIPSTATPTIYLYLPIAVTEFTALSTTISLPPGYRMALISNLAELMCLGLKPCPPDVLKLATLSLGTIKGVNLTEQIDALECDPALRPNNGAYFDYRTGGFR